MSYLLDVEDGGELVVPDGRHAIHRREQVGAERLGVVGERQRVQPLFYANRSQLLFAQLWKDNGRLRDLRTILQQVRPFSQSVIFQCMHA